MADRLNLSRAQLAQFLKDPQAIRQFERLFLVVDAIAPDFVNEIAIAAEIASARSAEVAANLSRIADALELLALAGVRTAAIPADDAAPVQITIAADEIAMPLHHAVAPDDLSPPVQIGTLGQQQADRVAITGGEVLAAITNTANILIAASQALPDGAAAAAGTLLNSPVAGNPTKWVPINDAGTTRYLPAW